MKRTISVIALLAFAVTSIPVTERHCERSEISRDCFASPEARLAMTKLAPASRFEAKSWEAARRKAIEGLQVTDDIKNDVCAFLENRSPFELLPNEARLSERRIKLFLGSLLGQYQTWETAKDERVSTYHDIGRILLIDSIYTHLKNENNLRGVSLLCLRELLSQGTASWCDFMETFEKKDEVVKEIDETLTAAQGTSYGKIEFTINEKAVGLLGDMVLSAFAELQIAIRRLKSPAIDIDAPELQFQGDRAAGELGRIFPTASRYLQRAIVWHLIEALKNPDVGVRIEAASILGCIGAIAPPELKELIKSALSKVWKSANEAGDEEPYIRLRGSIKTAIDIVGWDKDGEAILELTKILEEDPKCNITLLPRIALQRIRFNLSPPSFFTIPQLLATIINENEDPDNRRRDAILLFEIGKNKAAVSAVALYALDIVKEPRVRGLLVRGLIRLDYNILINKIRSLKAAKDEEGLDRIAECLADAAEFNKHIPDIAREIAFLYESAIEEDALSLSGVFETSRGAATSLLAPESRFGQQDFQEDALIAAIAETEASEARDSLDRILANALVNKPSLIDKIIVAIKETKDSKARNFLVDALGRALANNPDIKLSSEQVGVLITVIEENPKEIDSLIHALGLALAKNPDIKLSPEQADIFITAITKIKEDWLIGYGVAFVLGRAVANNPFLIDKVFVAIKKIGSIEVVDFLASALRHALANNRDIKLSPEQVNILIITIEKTKSIHAIDSLASALSCALYNNPDIKLSPEQADVLISAITKANYDLTRNFLDFALGRALANNPSLVGKVTTAINEAKDPSARNSLICALGRASVNNRGIKLSPEEAGIFITAIEENRKAIIEFLVFALENVLANNPDIKLSYEQVGVLITAIKETKDSMTRGSLVYVLSRALANNPDIKLSPEQADVLISAIEENPEEIDRLTSALANNKNSGYPPEETNAVIGVIKATKDYWSRSFLAYALGNALANNPSLVDNVITSIKKAIDPGVIDSLSSALSCALSNNSPELINIIVNLVIDTQTEAIIRDTLINSINQSIQQAEVGIGPEILLSLCNITDRDTKIKVFNKIIEPLFFKRADLFSDDVLEKLEAVYAEDVLQFKYLLFYASLKGIDSSAYDRQIFPSPHQDGFKELMSKGKKKVLVMHNIWDGQGDELIRNSTLIQALLDLNPELEVVVYTNRGYLYSHKRVEVRDINTYDLKDDEQFDMVIRHYDIAQRYSDETERRFQEYLDRHNYKTDPSHIYIKISKANDLFTHEEIVVAGRWPPLYSYAGNVYIPTYRLCAELGLPFRYGTQKPSESLFTSIPYPKADQYWEKTVAPANKENKQVVIFNGFGGENESKGYERDEKGKARFATALSEIIAEGFFVILLPNHKLWGTPEVAQEVVNRLSDEEQGSVLIAPLPTEDPLLHKYLVSKSDMVVTVEGGLMHLAYNMGMPFRVLSMFQSGHFSQWLPAGADSQQGAASELLGNRRASSSMLAPESRMKSQAQIVFDIDRIPEKMPAKELLRAIELDKAEVVKTEQMAGSVTVYSIRIPERGDPAKPPKGLEILYDEFMHTRDFDVLVNSKGHAIAIFPVLSEKLNREMFETGRNFYFNLSMYYFEVPPIGDPKAEEKWERFIKEVDPDTTVVNEYIRKMSILERRRSGAGHTIIHQRHMRMWN